jgi:hypothetical protein
MEKIFNILKTIVIILFIFLFFNLNISYSFEKIDGTPFFYKEKIAKFKEYEKITPQIEELKITHKVFENKVLKEEIGDTRKFWCYNFATKKYYQITATCKLVGEYSYIYVENNRNIPQDILGEILVNFEKNNGVYQICKILGEEPDIDGDKRITILFLDIIDDLKESGMYIAGYFSPLNEYPKSVEKYSNQREIIYIDILDKNPDSLIPTIAHEFQHMIHWNYDSLEEIWVDEGCSVFAEFLCGHPPDSSSKIISSFRENPGTSLICWENKFENYGIAYLFILYIFENCGGTFTIREIVQNKKTGIEGIDEVLKKRNKNFREIFKSFLITNYLDEKGGIYGYNSYEDKIGVKPNYNYSTFFLKSKKATLKPFSANYLEFLNPGNSSIFAFAFNGIDSKNFLVQYIIFKEENKEIRELNLDKNQDGNIKEDFSSKIVIIPSLISSDASGSYLYSLNDRDSPKISDLEVKNITEDSVSIFFKTDEDCFSLIEYKSNGQTYKLEAAQPDSFHQFQIQNLFPSTLYNYWCICKDAIGNTGVISSSFKTLPLSQLKIKAFPNPAKKFINFHYSYSPLTELVWIEIYNIRGKLIMKIFDETIDGNKEINFLDSFANGVYFFKVNIIESGKVFTKKSKFVVLK